MGYINTINNALANPNIRLLGQINLKDEEYLDLIGFTRTRVARLQQHMTAPPDIFLSVALVQIAIRRYSEGNYWEYFKDELDMDISPQRLTYIGQIFIATLRRYHYFQIERARGEKYAYVENIKAHAFVPNNYLSGYFDFLFAFYDQNLLRQLPENIDEDFSEMSEFFSDTLKDTSDSFTIKNLNNKPAKTYKLLKATRTLFAQGDSNVLAKIMYSHLKIIDEYYYDGKLVQEDNRFAKGFAEWVSTTTERIREDKPVTKRRKDVFYRKPYFHVDRASGEQLLFIPEQKIRNDDYDGTAYVDIVADGYNRRIPLSLYRAFGVLVSEPVHVSVRDIFSEYQITIVSKTERAFKIPQKNYRFFDDEFYEIPKLRSGQNYMLAKKGSKVSGLSAVYINDLRPLWDEFSYADVDDKSVIYVDGVPLSTTGRFVEGADFAFVSAEYDLFENEKKVQTVYKHPTVSFRVAKDAVEGSFLITRNKRLHIPSCAASIVDLPGEENVCGVTAKLDELIESEDGLYRVVLLEPRKKPKEITSYVMLQSLRCHPEKRRYVFAEEALVTVTGGYVFHPLNSIDVGDGANFILQLNDAVESADFSINVDNHDYVFRVPVSVFKHGFEGNLSSLQPDYLWHTELKNDLWISMPGATEAAAYIATKEINMEAEGIPQGNGLFRFDISAIAQYVKTSKRPYNYIQIKYKDNKKRKLKLYRVLNTVYVNRADIVFDKTGNIVANVDFEGKGELVLSFEEKETGRFIDEYKVENGINPLPGLSKDGFYTMRMYEVTPDPFGFTTQKKEICYPKVGVGAVNFDDISNCKIIIRSVTWEGSQLRMNFSYGLSHLKKIDELTYTGTLLERENGDNSPRKYKTNSVAENVLIECLPDEGRMEIISLQTEYEEGVYDPLYYDHRKKGLLNSEAVTGKDYKRFIALFDDNAVFDTEIRRVK